MKLLVTGSAGHLGEALVRSFRAQGHEVLGMDIAESPYTAAVGSITDRQAVRRCMSGIDAVLHSATLHKPHVVTHGMQAFIDTNITGTRVLLQAAVDAGVKTLVFTSTTSVFGEAMRPARAAPAVWVTEALQPVPRNIYGVTKLAAEGLCRLFHFKHGLNCPVLRTSRFFPETDDDADIRRAYADDNVKVNEYLYRRVDIEDVVSAHGCALERAADIGFDHFIVSATTPFRPEDAAELRGHAHRVVARRVPEFESVYATLDWKMFADIGRVYVNDKARWVLGWSPRHDFRAVLKRVAEGQGIASALARQIGKKGYHDEEFEDGPFPVD